MFVGNEDTGHDLVMRYTLVAPCEKEARGRQKRGMARVGALAQLTRGPDRGTRRTR